MQVLEQGRSKKGWAEEFICTGTAQNYGCGAKLLVEQDDVQQISIPPKTSNIFVCPKCGTINHIGNVSFLPKLIRKCITPECNNAAMDLYCSNHKFGHR